MAEQQQAWTVDEVRRLPLEWLDERLQRYRLQDPRRERQIGQSLERYGQLAPIVVCMLEGVYVLIDGFKRVRAARQLRGLTQLDARRMEVDAQGGKAALYTLNRLGQRVGGLEESWIVHALVREDGLSQVEVAQLLGRHKSWVCRRLALLEQLCDAAQEALRLGLLTPALARELARLPRGNQAAALQTAHTASLTCRELSGVVDLLLASSTREQAALVLEDPRRALRQADERYLHYWDPRLSVEGNRAAQRLALLLDCLAKMHSWLTYQGRRALQACDREPLAGGFQRLAREAAAVSEASEDFLQELQLP